MAYTNIPYIVEGEIITVNKVALDDTSPAGIGAALVSSTIGSMPNPIPRPVVSYVCRVTLAEGEEIVLPNVIEGSMFGGIDDYMQIRRRGTKDGGNTFKIRAPDDMKAHIGERVYIAFIGGSIFRPVIISFAQHPNQVVRFEEISPDVNPQLFMRYLGMDMTIDEDGQFFMTHFGAPEINYTGSDASTLANLGALAGEALGAVSSLGGDEYKGYEEGDETLNEPESDAVDPQDFKFKTIMEMLKDGTWRVRDSLGQMLWVDPKNSQIYLSNNGVKSSDPLDSSGGLQIESNSTDAEYLLLDRKKELVLINARKIAQIYSFDKRKDVTEGDHSHKVGGDEKITIAGDKDDEIDGSVTRVIKTDLDEEVSGNVTWKIDGDFEETLSGAVTWKAEDTLDWTVSGAMTLTCEDALDFSITSDWTVDCQGNFALTSKGDMSMLDATGAGWKVSSGKVEIGSGVAGLFDTVIQLEKQVEALIDAIGQITVPTAVGPSGPPINLPVIQQVKIQMTQITMKLEQVKGSL